MVNIFITCSRVPPQDMFRERISMNYFLITVLTEIVKESKGNSNKIEKNGTHAVGWLLS